MTSKVYPDKKWTGKISYISNYPKDNQNTAAAGAGNASSGAKYPYTVDITSEIGDLKQGFSINIEVKIRQEVFLCQSAVSFLKAIRAIFGQ